MPESQYTRVCFTLNNYTPEEEFQLLFLWKPMTFLVWGYETGEQGTPHIQGYFELNHKMRPSTIHKLNGLKRAHFEQAHGNWQQNVKYCTKEGEYVLFGAPRVSIQGKRTDLDNARECARDYGMREVTCWANFQQIRCAEKYLEYNEPARNCQPVVTWLWGKTGSGKSRAAKLMTTNAYRKSDTSKWWRGYDGQTELILDDFRDSWMPFTDLLSILDRYEHTVETKGGYRSLLATNIIITCNKPPDQLYRNLPEEDKNQLLRRITNVHKLGTGTQVQGVIVDNPLDSEIEDPLLDFY